MKKPMKRKSKAKKIIVTPLIDGQLRKLANMLIDDAIKTGAFSNGMLRTDPDIHGNTHEVLMSIVCRSTDANGNAFFYMLPKPKPQPDA